jgi:hypothetical protein
MTRAPRILAGEFSAAKIGTEEPLRPIPMPMSRRVMKSCSHDWAKAPPIGVSRQKIALMKIVCKFVSELSLDSICQMMTDSTTAEVVVARIRNPAADESTVKSQSNDKCGGLWLETSPSDIRTCVDESNKPTVADLVWGALCLALTNAEFLIWVSQRNVTSQSLFDLRLGNLSWLRWIQSGPIPGQQRL